MAYRELEGPGGQTYQVYIPDDASTEEARQYVRNYALGVASNPTAAKYRAKEQKVKQEEPSYGRAVLDQTLDIPRALGVGGLHGAANVGEMVTRAGELSPTHQIAKRAFPAYAKKHEEARDTMRRGQETIKGWYDEAPPIAGVGRLAAEAAGSAGPTTAVAKGIGSVLPKTLGRLRTAAQGAGAGATDALVTSPEDTGGSTLWGAGVGAVLPSVVRKSVKGIDVSPAAQRLIDKGIMPTTGQASTRHGQLSAVESGLRWLPWIGSKVEQAHDRARQSLQEHVIRKATPPGVEAPTLKGGKLSVDEVTKQIQDLHSTARKNIAPNARYVKDPSLVQGVSKVLSDPTLKISPDSSKLVEGDFASEILGRLLNPNTSTADMLEGVSKLRAAGYVARNKGDRAAGVAYGRVADSVIDFMEKQSPGVKKSYDELRGPLHSLAVLDKARDKSPALGSFSGKQLQDAARKYRHPELYTTGREAATVLGTEAEKGGLPREGARQALGWLGAIFAPGTLAATAASSGIYSKPAQKALLGQTDFQKNLAKKLANSQFSEILE